MKVPLGWLAEWIELPASRARLEERLTVGGLEIEDVIETGPDLRDVVVGRVLAREAHPDADRLSLCRVEVGEGEPVEIVCGAPNVAAGQKVAVARHGVVLPDGTRIKRSKIRGVRSHGMICSTRELGLGEEHAGILVLDPDAPVGAPLPDVLPAGETVLDVEITPNRGDWVSMLGMAREVRAHFGGTLRMPETATTDAGAPAGEAVAVAIEDRAGCHRYVARVVRGVEVGPSPTWLVARLETAGVRAINNVVDVTNLVMLEFGQPLHAFDLARIAGGEIRVRAAAAGEKIRTLDGQLRELRPEDIVIADAREAVAVAGVMGGAESEVGEATRDVLLESAHFDPSRVRRTARRLGLHSDASYRFERGVDPEGQRRAADRAARLLEQVAGGTSAPDAVDVRGDPPPATETIRLEPARVNRLLGTDLDADAMAALLARVDVASAPDGDTLVCRPPSWRSDLHLPVDLVEEIARIHGYDRIDEALPHGPLAGVSEPADRGLREAVRGALVAAGLTEVMTFPAVPEDDPAALGIEEPDPRAATLRLVNPIQSGEGALRTTLVPSLLRVARANLSRQVSRLAIFELSRVFRPATGGGLPDEPLEAVALLVDAGEPALWEAREVPIFFRAKGLAERLLAELGRPGRLAPACDEPYLHPGASATFRVEAGSGSDRDIARVGELHPAVADRFGVSEPAALVVVDVAALLEVPAPPPRLQEPSRHPQVRRDLAVLLDADVRAGEVAEAIRKRGGSALVSVEVFDRYEGKGIPAGRVSLAFRLVFQQPDRTLTDAEVAKATERVVHLLEERFGGELR